MTMKIDKDGFTLSTGRAFYAYSNILGINHQGGVYEGYDRTLDVEPAFTPEERKEIAEHFIAQWKKWATLD